MMNKISKISIGAFIVLFGIAFSFNKCKTNNKEKCPKIECDSMDTDRLKRLIKDCSMESEHEQIQLEKLNKHDSIYYIEKPIKNDKRKNVLCNIKAFNIISIDSIQYVEDINDMIDSDDYFYINDNKYISIEDIQSLIINGQKYIKLR